MTVGGRLGNHIENMKMPINNYFMQKKIKHPSTTVSNIRIYSDNILFHEINQNIAVEGHKASCKSFHWTCFRCFDVSEI